MQRADITKALTQAAIHYWVKKRYGVYTEIALVKRGRKRADVYALNMYGFTVLCEIKSCVAESRQ